MWTATIMNESASGDTKQEAIRSAVWLYAPGTMDNDYAVDEEAEKIRFLDELGTPYLVVGIKLEEMT